MHVFCKLNPDGQNICLYGVEGHMERWGFLSSVEQRFGLYYI